MRCIATWHNQKKTMLQRHTCRSSMSWCHSLLASVTACNVAFASHLGMFLIYIYTWREWGETERGKEVCTLRRNVIVQIITNIYICGRLNIYIYTHMCVYAEIEILYMYKDAYMYIHM